MFKLNALAAALTEAGLEGKTFFSMNKDEITQVCEMVVNAFDDEVPATGWVAPHLDETSQDIVYPLDCHPIYRWWTPKGKPILDVLAELGAPYEMAEKYFNRGEDFKPTLEEWRERVK